LVFGEGTAENTLLASKCRKFQHLTVND